jgi:hypothetical protein
MRFFNAAAILAGAFLLSVAATAGDDSWTVLQATGQTWIQKGDRTTPVSLGGNTSLAAGDILRTQANARVLLRRGQETMIVGPNTVMSVPAESDRLRTTIIQWQGAIQFDVEKRNVQHFEVKTPFLAAVVKGTNFTVVAAESRDSVTVNRGQVQVRDRRTGKTTNVIAGQSATVSTEGLQVSHPADRAAASPATNQTEASLLGSVGVSASVGSQGVSAGIGGDNGVSVGVSGTNGISASVGGPGGIGVGIGGGNGIGVGIGGVSIGIGGGR